MLLWGFGVLGFGIQGLGVWGLGFLGFEAQSLGLRVYGSGFKVLGLGPGECLRLVAK